VLKLSWEARPGNAQILFSGNSIRAYSRLFGLSKPFHLLDFVDFGAARSFDLYYGAHGFADQRAGDWRSHGNLPLARVGFRFTNDLPCLFLAGTLFDQRHGGPNLMVSQFFGNCPIRVDTRFCRAHPYTDKSRRCDSHSTLEGRTELGRPLERRSPRSASNTL